MKTRIFTLAAMLCTAASLAADVPTSINYQGIVQVDGSDFNGTGRFKFALVRTDIRVGLTTLWSNDGTSIFGSEPTASIKLPVSGGLFTVGLGDTAIANMTQAIDATDVNRDGVRLRVWFDDEVNGFARLAPDRLLRSVPYALQAASLIDGAITSDQIAPNSIGSAQLANDLSLISLDIGSLLTDGNLRLLGRYSGGGIIDPEQEFERVKIYADAPSAFLGQPTFSGGIDLFDQSETLRISARAHQASIALNESNGAEGVFLRGDTTTGGGLVNVLGTNASPGVQLLGQQSASSGGIVSLFDSAGNERVKALGVNGTVRLFNEGSTQTTLLMTGDSGEFVALDSLGIADTVGDNLLKASLAKNSRGGAIRTRSSTTEATSTLLSTSTTGGGRLDLYDASGDGTVQLESASSAASGARLQLRETDGTLTVRLGAEGAGGGGFLSLRDGDGNTVIELDASENGEAITRTQVLEITGGSDLSEKFDISPAPGQDNTPPAPGALVCIDPANPGALITSSRAYDRTVAGIVSGAGGVKPGMLMGQRGSIADGAMPVALTGRVYCLADASFGPIEPGDLLTTSDTPGHGMRVGDHDQATGSVIGKAMTRLESGRGLVLVLVSLQ